MSDWITDEAPCDERCPIPPGVRLSIVPRPRHAWGDVIPCQHCDRAFLVHPDDVARLRAAAAALACADEPAHVYGHEGSPL